MNVYILDDIIIFSPTECTFTSAADSKKSQSLSEPASRCFEKLLTAGGLVSQNDLYELGWEGRAIIPSPNTLYQTISSLRKCFKALNPSGLNPILTETRKGFRINPALNVRLEIFEDIDSAEVLPKELKQPDESDSLFRRKKFNSKLLIGISSIVILLSLFYTIKLIQSTTDAFQSYHAIKIPSFPECKFFVSDLDRNIEAKTLSNAEFNCSVFPYNYITIYPYYSNVSILSCSQEVDSKKNNCHILSLRGEVK